MEIGLQEDDLALFGEEIPHHHEGCVEVVVEMVENPVSNDVVEPLTREAIGCVHDVHDLKTDNVLIRVSLSLLHKTLRPVDSQNLHPGPGSQVARDLTPSAANLEHLPRR